MTHTYIHKSSFLYFIDNKIYVLLSLLVCALPLPPLSVSLSLSLPRSSSRSVSPFSCCLRRTWWGGGGWGDMICVLWCVILPGEVCQGRILPGETTCIFCVNKVLEMMICVCMCVSCICVVVTIISLLCDSGE